MADYYDTILGIIPAVLVGITTTAYTFGVNLNVALATGGLTAIAAMVHGLFINAPTPNTPHTETIETEHPQSHQQPVADKSGGPTPTSD